MAPPNLVNVCALLRADALGAGFEYAFGACQVHQVQRRHEHGFRAAHHFARLYHQSIRPGNIHASIVTSPNLKPRNVVGFPPAIIHISQVISTNLNRS
jgi:hypothetical protein